MLKDSDTIFFDFSPGNDSNRDFKRSQQPSCMRLSLVEIYAEGSHAGDILAYADGNTCVLQLQVLIMSIISIEDVIH